jgi:dTMP kinase
VTGKFITLEGIDGAGKSTHLAWLTERICARGVEVVTTREPGGTPLGETLRELLLNEKMHPDCEALLMFAARAEHMQQVIRPALTRGAWVISDRFTDATFAYQCGGRGIAEERIVILEKWVQQGLQPDLTLLFDAPLGIARERLDRNTANPDRFEREREDFFRRVRTVYLKRAETYPQRIKLINSADELENIQEELEKIIARL